MSGEQLKADIYIGPTYYMRLKHMVKDKINYRARGPNTALTRQPVQGRANDGGLRIGEMERDGVLSHGMSYFLNESFLVRGDEYYIAICNKTGAISIYNEEQNLFLSPYADGPIHFFMNPDGSQNIQNLTKFGRSFSILKIPYSLKLLIQELLVMNVQMRIITDDNVNQLLSMSYSNNINKLMRSNDTIQNICNNIKVEIKKIELNSQKSTFNKTEREKPELQNFVTKEEFNQNQNQNQNTPEYPPSQNTPEYPPSDNSPMFIPKFKEETLTPLPSTQFEPNLQETTFDVKPLSPSPSPSLNTVTTTTTITSSDKKDKDNSTQGTILDVETPKEENSEEKEKEKEENKNTNEKKTIVFNEPTISNSETNVSETKKIIL
jgi:DNA-directed RNA polymerase II subunit RPB2